MARRKSVRTAVQRPDVRSRVAEPLRLLIGRLSGLESHAFELPYRLTLDAIERGEDVTVYGWQISDVVPAIDPHGRYVLHSDNTLTEVVD